MALGMITTSLISVLFMMTCRFFFGLFVEDETVMVIAVQILGFMAPWYWTYAPIEIFGGGLRGLGDTLIPTIITAAGICLTRVIWIYTAVPRWHSISTVAQLSADLGTDRRCVRDILLRFRTQASYEG